LKYSAPLFGGALGGEAIRAPIFSFVVLGSDHHFNHRRKTLELVRSDFSVLHFSVSVLPTEKCRTEKYRADYNPL
jgi:hypothetical protein